MGDLNRKDISNNNKYFIDNNWIKATDITSYNIFYEARNKFGISKKISWVFQSGATLSFGKMYSNRVQNVAPQFVMLNIITYNSTRSRGTKLLETIKLRMQSTISSIYVNV